MIRDLVKNGVPTSRNSMAFGSNLEMFSYIATNNKVSSLTSNYFISKDFSCYDILIIFFFLGRLEECPGTCTHMISELSLALEAG